MANSTNFFGLRRGSTKSHTYQVFRGQQITKDRVTDVANPQSTLQMKQRLKLPMVAAARAQLKGLVDHSFEGVEYGFKSLQHFSSLNLRKSSLDVDGLSFVPKGFKDCGVANYTVSQGSLKSISATLKPKPAYPALDTLETALYFGNQSVDLSALNAALAEAGAVNDGSNHKLTPELAKVVLTYYASEDIDQLSFLLGFTVYDTNPTKLEIGAGTYEVDRHKFILARLSSDATIASKWEYFYKPNQFHLYQGALRIINDGTTADTEPKNAQPVLEVINRDDYFETDLKAPPFYSELEMGAVIASKKDGDIWRRSTEELSTAGLDSGLDFDIAVQTYIKNNSSSDYYLNEGSKTTGIVTA